LETKTELIYNPCFGNIKINKKKSKEFILFIKQVNYKDEIFINNNNSFTVGEVYGFNNSFVYVSHSKLISEFSWDEVEYVEKVIPLHNINNNEDKSNNTKSNIIAIIITIIIFFATFIMGIIYSGLPLLFK